MKRALICGAAALLVGALVLGYSVGRARAFGAPSTNPGALSYTGSLLTFGQPDNNAHQISVGLWPNGATSAACTEPAASIQVTNGQFTVPLPASCVTVIHQSPNVQIQVTIDGIAMGMTQLAAVPYALESGSVAATPVLTNIGLTTSVGSNALTVTLTQGDGASTPTATNPSIIGFSSSGTSSAALTFVQVASGPSITVPSSASLGQTNGVTAFTYIYAQSESGTVQLCVSSSGLLDEGVTQTSIAIGSGSTSSTGLYCQAAVTGPVRLIGRVQATEATAGVWATSPTSVAVPPFIAPAFRAPNVQRFTTAGAQTYAPSAGLVYAVVEAQGAGGGGGGTATYTTSFGCNTGMGGGAGGYAKALVTVAQLALVESGGSVPVSVGSAGGGGGAGAGGVAGGTSYFGSTSFLEATGGGGGGTVLSQGIQWYAGGGAGGTGTISSAVQSLIAIAGQAGGQVLGDGVSGIGYLCGSGAGGSSFLGLGGPGTGLVGGNTPEPGASGTGYGSGGGGSVSGGANESGGTGGPGIVVVTEYFD